MLIMNIIESCSSLLTPLKLRLLTTNAVNAHGFYISKRVTIGSHTVHSNPNFYAFQRKERRVAYNVFYVVRLAIKREFM